MPLKRSRATTDAMAGTIKKLKNKSRKGGPLPVTLLSGFLGSGKTTLLQHILKANHGHRIAVIVNDIGAINVDASVIKSTRITQTKAEVVSLQNGCICCTLRGDLISELIELSEKHDFDYVLIESSGISEPGQVAESFDAGLSEKMLEMAKEEGNLDPKLEKSLKKLHQAGEAGLAKFARLDTTVTVIDAASMLQDFQTADFLSDRRNDVVPEDERTVSHLMVDQIEFADVIILNKTDKATATDMESIHGIVKHLNHRAKVLTSSYGRVDVREILNTKLFDLEVARTGAGWLDDLHQMMVRNINGKNVITPQPETEEYNVRNFIYCRRRPFHPERLMKFIHDKFILQLEHPDVEEDEVQQGAAKTAPAPKPESENEETEVSADDTWEDLDRDSEEQDRPSSSHSSARSSADTGITSHDDSDADEDVDEDDLISPPNDEILANKRAHPLVARLFRSKGIFWLATRPDFQGSWSQAGAMLALLSDRQWWCTLTDDELSAVCPDAELKRQVEHDIKAGADWGDRRQEIVFIGEKLDIKGIEATLDACLLDDDEWEAWQSTMKRVQKKQQEFFKIQEDLQKAKDMLTWELKDGFPDWDASFIDEMDEEEDDEDHDGHHH